MPLDAVKYVIPMPFLVEAESTAMGKGIGVLCVPIRIVEGAPQEDTIARMLLLGLGTRLGKKGQQHENYPDGRPQEMPLLFLRRNTVCKIPHQNI